MAGLFPVIVGAAAAVVEARGVVPCGDALTLALGVVVEAAVIAAVLVGEPTPGPVPADERALAAGPLPAVDGEVEISGADAIVGSTGGGVIGGGVESPQPIAQSAESRGAPATIAKAPRTRA